jgi:hypothetical protein
MDAYIVKSVSHILTPLRTFTSAATGKPIDYYEIEIKDLHQQTYPELGPTKYVGYDGIFPGPVSLQLKQSFGQY